MAFLAAVPLGLLIGAILGLVGAGGSILAVPALIYGLGMAPHDAIPSSLVVVGIAALTAVLPRLRTQVDWRTAAAVGAAGIPAAWAGAAVNRMLDPDALLLAFAVLMLAAAWRMLAPSPSAGGEPHERSTLVEVLRSLGVGVIVGFLTGIFGIGGGFIITPALVILLGLPMQRAVGTSLVVIVINAVGGFAAHAQSAELDWPLVLTFTGAAVAGSLVAARFGAKLPNRAVTIAFAGVLLAVAAFVIVQAAIALAA